MRFGFWALILFGALTFGTVGCGGGGQAPEEVDKQEAERDQAIFDDPASGPGSGAASADQMP